MNLAHSCTRFPCYLGMEINRSMQRLNEQQQRLSSWAINYNELRLKQTCCLTHLRQKCVNAMKFDKSKIKRRVVVLKF